MLNRATIIGRLGKKPELRYTQSNQAVCNFTVATNDSWTDKQSGEKKESTEWHRIIVWGKQAENCEKYLEKGRLVCVEGSIKTRKWTNKDGADQYTTEIDAQRVHFLGDRQEKSEGQTQSNGPPDDDDIPY